MDLAVADSSVYSVGSLAVQGAATGEQSLTLLGLEHQGVKICLWRAVNVETCKILQRAPMLYTQNCAALKIFLSVCNKAPLPKAPEIIALSYTHCTIYASKPYPRP